MSTIPTSPSSPNSPDPSPPTGATSVRRDRRPRSRGSRVAGYLIAAAINAALLYAIHVWPGWEAVPFLTDATVDVLPIVDASLIAGIVVNLLYVIGDPRWLRGLGDAVTAVFALAVLVQVWTVFPFTFAGEGWAWLVRLGLAIGILGSGIGIIVGVVRFLGGIISGGRAHPV
ncbi:MAG: hypothetical protein R2737_03115 [Candidatus Nanopelagicales bacterium]